MNAINNLARRTACFLTVKSQRGVTALEYGLLAALIALAIITAVTLLGGNLSGVFNSVATKVKAPA
jgi:pilus assembly protein Flp/PilA